MTFKRRLGLSYTDKPGYSLHFNDTSQAAGQPRSLSAVSPAAIDKAAKVKREPSVEDSPLSSDLDELAQPPSSEPPNDEEEALKSRSSQKRKKVGKDADSRSSLKRKRDDDRDVKTKSSQKRKRDEEEAKLASKERDSDSDPFEQHNASMRPGSNHGRKKTFGKGPRISSRISTVNDNYYRGLLCEDSKDEKVTKKKKGRKDASTFSPPAPGPTFIPPRAQSGPNFIAPSTVPGPTFKPPSAAPGPTFKPPSNAAGDSLSRNEAKATRCSGRGKDTKNPLNKSSKTATSVVTLPETAMLMKTLGIKKGAPGAIDDNISSSAGQSAPSVRSRADSTSSLSSLNDSDVSTSLDITEKGNGNEMNGMMRCSVCQDRLPSVILRQYLLTLPEHKRKERLTTKYQLRFCKYHKEHAAKQEWRNRSYPEIEWTIIPRRIQELQDEIDSIIGGTTESPYSDELLGTWKDVGGRRQKVMSEFDGDFGMDLVGYYGGQGAKIIGQEVTRLCNFKLRENSGNNVFTAAGGMGMYLQKVIVPEVASRLIAQDLNCDLPAARNVLVESADLGAQLNEELNDEVHEDEENDAI